MKKLVALADTHGNRKGVEALLPIIRENDYLLHLGDGVGDVREIYRENPEKVYACAGNCDLFSPYPEEGVLEVEQVRIFYCHGHKYGVKKHLYALAERAKELDCALAFYGHTHTPLISTVNGVTLINPGSLHLPLDTGGSYAYVVVNKKEITPVIVGGYLR